MAKPILKFKVNQQSAEVGGKFYGIIEDTPVTPENSILQICEFKKITAFTPEQVLRLVEDVCDGAAKLVARDGQSRQLSSLLKFSPRVRGTFNAVDSRWGDQKLIVGARLLKDIKLNMNPSDFVMSNVADVGTLSSASISGDPLPTATDSALTGRYLIRINGSKLDTWDPENTFAKPFIVVDGETYFAGFTELNGQDFASNGFNFVLDFSVDTSTVIEYFSLPSSIGIKPIDSWGVAVYHPSQDVEFKRLTLQITE